MKLDPLHTIYAFYSRNAFWELLKQNLETSLVEILFLTVKLREALDFISEVVFSSRIALFTVNSSAFGHSDFSYLLNIRKFLYFNYSACGFKFHKIYY